MVDVPSDAAAVPLEKIEYRAEPSVLIVADSAAGMERAGHAAGAAGCRVSGTFAPGDAAGRLDRQVALDALLIDVSGVDADGELSALFDRAEAAARAGSFRTIISTPIGLVDLVAARTMHADIFQLCEAGPAEWRDSVMLATMPRTIRLEDVNKQGLPPRLAMLSEAMGQIASILASLPEEEALAAGGPEDGDRQAESQIDAGQILAMIRARRLRDDYFKGGLFADPAWDMLLDLMVARLERKRVAVSSLCIAAAVPPTTALRWIKALTERGHFVRVADAQDGRRVFIELSDKTAAKLEAYLGAAQRISPLMV